jgi:hypothetical protein
MYKGILNVTSSGRSSLLEDVDGHRLPPISASVHSG